MNAPADNRTDQSLEPGFRLGELMIDPNAGEVSGPGGREKLDARVMEVLVMLAQHAGQVVLREDLLARLWPNTVVTDDVLTRCIYELRRQLSQAGGDEQIKGMLETVPKRGYRLNGEVIPLQPQPGGRSRHWSNRIALGLAIAIGIGVLLWFAFGRQASGPADAEDSIAVLPFLDMSAGQDQGYLADGITEEILNRLTQSGNLRVISRTSSFSFRGKPMDIRDIAARLNVSHVLEGSIRRSDDNIRITAQLISASDNAHVWSDTFDRKLGDLFTVQDAIAGSVAAALQVELDGDAAQAPGNAAAFERFLQGQFFYNRRAPGDIERAVKYYEEALAIEPDFARAWAALAGASMLMATDGGQSAQEWRRRQGEAAQKAVELEPGLAVAHARLAQYYFHMADRKRGEEHSKKALALDPDDPLVLGAAAGRAAWNGDFEAAAALQQKFVALDPLSAAQRSNLGHYLLAAGHLDQALQEYHTVPELSPDSNMAADARLEIVRILVLRRRYDETESVIAQWHDDTYRDYGMAWLYDAPGRRADAEAALRRLRAQPADTRENVRLAETYVFRGMTEEAFATLQKLRAEVERDGGSALPRFWDMQEDIRSSHWLKPLHDDPRWSALIAHPA